MYSLHHSLGLPWHRSVSAALSNEVPARELDELCKVGMA
jgi:hypothetical protein